jgi:hypothetical protein
MGRDTFENWQFFEAMFGLNNRLAPISSPRPQADHWLRPGVAERVGITPAAAGRPRTLTILVSCTVRFVVRTAILGAWLGWRSNELLW